MTSEKIKKKKGEFPFPIVQVCAICEYKVAPCGTLCSGGTPHNWIRPKYRHPITQSVVRSPRFKRTSYSLCSDIKHCRQKEQCSYAHNEYERAIWTWMAEKEVFELSLIFHRYQIPQIMEKEVGSMSLVTDDMTYPPDMRNTSTSWTKLTKIVAPQMDPAILRSQHPIDHSPIKPIINSRVASRRRQEHHLFCGACCKQLPDQRQWREHVESKDHRRNVHLMQEKEWTFRPPLSPNGPFQICPLDDNGSSCYFSKVSYSENRCEFAHSQEELAEWNERIRFKRVVNNFPRDEILPENFELLPENLPNLKLKYDQELSQCVTRDLPVQFRWIFTITLPNSPDLPSTGPLTMDPQWSIILCVRAFCLNFSITVAAGDKPSATSPKKCFRMLCRDLLISDKLKNRFKSSRQLVFEVLFDSLTCGSFHQIVVLDLGENRRVKIPLDVDVTTKASFEKFRNFIREERWELDKLILIPYNLEDNEDERGEYYEEKKLEINEVRNLERSFTLQPNNYKVVWHSLMYLESAYRQNLLVDLPVTNLKLKLTEVIAVSGLTIAIPGTIFAELDFVKNEFTEKISSRSSDSDSLMADFNSILLLLQTAVRYAWLRSSQSQEAKVYAVQVVDEERFGVDAKLASSVYLHLPRHCLEDHPDWTKDREITVDLQFRLDMRFFKEIHDAIDDTVCDDQGSVVVMPDSENILALRKLPLSPRILQEVDRGLDDVQNQIRRVISEPSLPRFTPPFVMFGCFGAGKTQTIGRTVLSLLERRRESPPRILICTHNNCAADLYITRYLHPFITRNKHIKLIRLYYHMRKWFNKTPDQQICNQYALVSTDGTNCSYRSVCEEDVRGVHVIVTTLSTSFQLRNIPQLVPEFKLDYIFIDEAAQVLEVEVLTPLMLLTEKTKVIVAGDTMQVTPKLFCPEVRDCAVDSTILLRLYKLYKHLEESCGAEAAFFSDRNINFKFVMNAVYRSHSDIVQFLSKAFYNENLLPECPPISLPQEWPALSIFCVYGANPAAILSADFPTQHYSGGVLFQPDLRSCICESEALAVVDQVCLLCNMWPSDWPRTQAGGPDVSQICVVSDEFAQVKLIRSKLREKRLPGVVVENLRNIQGREFQAVFVSPVHTRDHFVIGRERFDETCSSNQLFTDIRVINTTLSRARALVQVVGDPVGLALINDKTSDTWKKFIGHCVKSLEYQKIDFGELKRVTETLRSKLYHSSDSLSNEVFTGSDASKDVDSGIFSKSSLIERAVSTCSSSSSSRNRRVRKVSAPSKKMPSEDSLIFTLNPDASSFNPPAPVNLMDVDIVTAEERHRVTRLAPPVTPPPKEKSKKKKTAKKKGQTAPSLDEENFPVLVSPTKEGKSIGVVGAVITTPTSQPVAAKQSPLVTNDVKSKRALKKEKYLESQQSKIDNCKADSSCGVTAKSPAPPPISMTPQQNPFLNFEPPAHSQPAVLQNSAPPLAPSPPQSLPQPTQPFGPAGNVLNLGHRPEAALMAPNFDMAPNYRPSYPPVQTRTMHPQFMPYNGPFQGVLRPPYSMGQPVNIGLQYRAQMRPLPNQLVPQSLQNYRAAMLVHQQPPYYPGGGHRPQLFYRPEVPPTPPNYLLQRRNPPGSENSMGFSGVPIQISDTMRNASLRPSNLTELARSLSQPPIQLDTLPHRELPPPYNFISLDSQRMLQHNASPQPPDHRKVDRKKFDAVSDSGSEQLSFESCQDHLSSFTGSCSSRNTNIGDIRDNLHNVILEEGDKIEAHWMGCAPQVEEREKQMVASPPPAESYSVSRDVLGKQYFLFPNSRCECANIRLITPSHCLSPGDTVTVTEDSRDVACTNLSILIGQYVIGRMKQGVLHPLNSYFSTIRIIDTGTSAEKTERGHLTVARIVAYDWSSSQYEGESVSRIAIDSDHRLVNNAFLLSGIQPHFHRDDRFLSGSAVFRDMPGHNDLYNDAVALICGTNGAPGCAIDVAFSHSQSRNDFVIHILNLNAFDEFGVVRNEALSRGLSVRDTGGVMGGIYPKGFIDMANFSTSYSRPAISLKFQLQLRDRGEDDILVSGGPTRVVATFDCVSWSLVRLCREPFSYENVESHLLERRSEHSINNSYPFLVLRDLLLDWIINKVGWGWIVQSVLPEIYHPSQLTTGLLLDHGVRHLAQFYFTRHLSERGQTLPLLATRRVFQRELSLWRLLFNSAAVNHPFELTDYLSESRHVCHCPLGRCACQSRLNQQFGSQQHAFMAKIVCKIVNNALRDEENSASRLIPILFNRNLYPTWLRAHHELRTVCLQLPPTMTGSSTSSDNFTDIPGVVPLAYPLTRGIDSLVACLAQESDQSLIPAACIQYQQAALRLDLFDQSLAVKSFSGVKLYQLVYLGLSPADNQTLRFAICQNNTRRTQYVEVTLPWRVEEEEDCGITLIHCRCALHGEIENFHYEEEERHDEKFDLTEVRELRHAANRSGVSGIPRDQWRSITRSVVNALFTARDSIDLSSQEALLDIGDISSSPTLHTDPVLRGVVSESQVTVTLSPGAILPALIRRSEFESTLSVDTLYLSEFLPVCAKHLRCCDVFIDRSSTLDEDLESRRELIRNSLNTSSQYFHKVRISWVEIPGDEENSTFITGDLHLREEFHLDTNLDYSSGLVCLHSRERSHHSLVVHGYLLTFDQFKVTDITHSGGGSDFILPRDHDYDVEIIPFREASIGD